MKICPKCSRRFDDSWGRCLHCDTALVAEGGEAAGTVEALAAAMHEEFAKIHRRLTALEKASGTAVSSADAPAERPAPAPAPPASRPAVASAGPARPAAGRDLESTIGLVWLNRIGVLALLLGAAFFLKYAFDNRWIGELGRVVLGLAGGALLLGGAEVARRKGDDVVSQGLHGAGAGILYLSIFAAFAFYRLIGVVPALGFMSTVTAYSFFWSVRANWMSAAIIATAGGFLTVYFVGMKHLAPALLFPYIAVLDLGVLGVSLARPWRPLNLLSFLLTHLVFATWLGTPAAAEHWVGGCVYAALFFAVFSVLSIAHNLVRRALSDATDILLVLVNGIVFFGEINQLAGKHAGPFPALLPMLLAVLYLFYSHHALSRRSGDRALIQSYAGLVILFVTVAFPVQFGTKWAVLGWIVETAVLFWIGFRTELAMLRRYALVVGALALFMLVSNDPLFSFSGYAAADRRFLLNEDALLYFAAAAAAFFSARLYRQNRGKLPPSETGVATLFVILANVLLVYRLSAECQVYFAHAAKLAVLERIGAAAKVTWQDFSTEYAKLFSPRQLSISAVWIVYALGSVIAGMQRSFRALRIFGLVLFGMAVFKIFLVDLSGLDRFYRVLSFLGLGAVLMATSLIYQRHGDRIREFALKD
jgi:uncharacterized membrane protein